MKALLGSYLCHINSKYSVTTFIVNRYYFEVDVYFGSNQIINGKPKSASRCITIKQFPGKERVKLLKSTCSKPAKALQSTNLNTIDIEKEEVDAKEKSEMVQPKEVKCTVSIPTYYYVPSDQISLALSIINNSSMNLKIVTVEFVSVEEYDVARRGKDCKTVVVETTHMVIQIVHR